MTAMPQSIDPAAGARRAGLLRRLFTVDDYHRMAEVGLLHEDERTELLDGEVVFKMPIGSRHAGCVKWLNHNLGAQLQDRAIIGAQDPVRLDRFSEPEPDISVLRPRADMYRDQHPGPDDVLLIIEVADSSLYVDRLVKAPLYAAAGVQELWLVDLSDDSIEVCREPVAESYRSIRRYVRGEQLAAAAFPDVKVTVDDILGLPAGAHAG
jgi:Uma2 family endonuclease